MPESPIEELRTDEALRHQHRAAIAERVGWGFMALLVVAALIGLLGPGPLSLSRAESDDGMLVAHYSRFVRNGTSTGLDVDLTLDDPSSEPRLLIDTAYLDAFTISDIRPAPKDVVARGDQIEFVFAPPGTPSITISFDLSVDHLGSRNGAIQSGSGTSVHVSHFVYP